MKFLGIEDMWGNLGQWLDGIYCDNNYNIKTDYKNSVFTGTTGDNFQFSTPGNRSSGNIKAILGTNISGFVLKSTDGDYNNDYFSDDGIIYSGGRFAGYAGYR